MSQPNPCSLEAETTLYRSTSSPVQSCRQAASAATVSASPALLTSWGSACASSQMPQTHRQRTGGPSIASSSCLDLGLAFNPPHAAPLTRKLPCQFKRCLGHNMYEAAANAPAPRRVSRRAEGPCSPRCPLRRLHCRPRAGGSAAGTPAAAAAPRWWSPGRSRWAALAASLERGFLSLRSPPAASAAQQQRL